MESTALVPLGVYQHCAMASVAYVEHRRTMGRNLGELAYAKAFFRALTGKAQITSSDVRQVDASYDPSVRGESTKMDYMRAIDLLIDTRGEVVTLPLSWSVAVAMFPGIQNRVSQRRDHREKIMELRDQRKTTSHLQSKEISFQNAKTVSSQRLIFCRPGEHKQWLRDWHDEIHGQCLRESDIYMMLRTWWSKFWVTRYRSDYIWCNSLHELLDEIDYVLSSMTLLEYNLCVSALPLSIAFQSDK